MDRAAESQAVYGLPLTLRSRLRQMPPLKEEGLWPAQIKAIGNLEKSLAENRPRALIQMATGSGKTFTAVTSIYRMIKFGGARRVLFLVDRANLGRQTLKEFQQYVSPYSPYKFTEEYIVQQPELRRRLVELYKTTEQTIDVVSKDEVLVSAFSAEALENAKKTVISFERFIKEHKDEITALQILYSRPYKARLRFEEIKALAQLIEKPPYSWKIDRLWEAYAALEKSKVKGASAPHILTDLVSLVRFAIHQDNELVPFPEKVNVNFNAWMAQQEINRRGMGLPTLTDEQRRWLEMIRDHIAANLSIEAGDFDYAPFAQQGGLGKVHQVFGDELNKIIEELNGVLAA
ncbi:MAG: DEAD/DEAH box helicase family protein [Nitrospiraceae bacterium]|nr:DEAD/DEAH box helicase family protein [Nitrospiraceae bacterium]